MELRDIEYFAVVAEHRHLGRAAEALDLSTAALSKSLRRLEASVQAKLVKRTPRGVELTCEGSALLARARGLRTSLADLAREIGDLSRGRVGRVRVGAHPGLLRELLGRACSEVLADAPEMSLEVTIGANDVLEAALADGELDLIVNGAPATLPDMLQEHLYDDELVVYCAAGHPLARADRVTLNDLALERWAMWSPNVPSWQRLQQAYADAGLPPPTIAMVTSSVSLRFDVVASSGLLGLNLRHVVREAAARHGLVELRVAELALPVTTTITWRKGAYMPPAGRRFIEALKAAARDITTRKSREAT